MPELTLAFNCPNYHTVKLHTPPNRSQATAEVFRRFSIPPQTPPALTHHLHLTRYVSLHGKEGTYLYFSIRKSGHRSRRCAINSPSRLSSSRPGASASPRWFKARAIWFRHPQPCLSRLPAQLLVLTVVETHGEHVPPQRRLAQLWTPHDFASRFVSEGVQGEAPGKWFSDTENITCYS